jgi:hypothetical protein
MITTGGGPPGRIGARPGIGLLVLSPLTLPVALGCFAHAWIGRCSLHLATLQGECFGNVIYMCENKVEILHLAACLQVSGAFAVGPGVNRCIAPPLHRL